MPLYDLKCANCGRVFEVIQPNHWTPNPLCSCGGPTKRLPCAASPQFKGPGFYATDYKEKP